MAVEDVGYLFGRAARQVELDRLLRPGQGRARYHKLGMGDVCHQLAEAEHALFGPPLHLVRGRGAEGSRGLLVNTIPVFDKAFYLGTAHRSILSTDILKES
jgi:hypothetical protein